MTYPNVERIDSAPAYMAGFSSETDFALTNLAHRQEEEAELAWRYARAANQADANALCDWAPSVNDWEASRLQPREVGAPMPQRVQTMAEVMEESLDYGTGPSKAEAMQLILNAARCSDAEVAKQASELLARMGACFASHNV